MHNFSNSEQLTSVTSETNPSTNPSFYKGDQTIVSAK